MASEADFVKTADFQPTFDGVESEKAVKHSYDAASKTWSKSQLIVKVVVKPFATGGMRRAHFMQVISASDKTAINTVFVAKFFLSQMGDSDYEMKKLYFQDVEQQMIAKHYATLFNKYKPPKTVDFLEAFIVELVDRPAYPMNLCGVEQYIAGNYCKWNNNYGFVVENSRNTPQAFSHFTWERSLHTIVIVDIQGVNDLYTDPAIHTMAEEGADLFSGNMGRDGIMQFLRSHKCNPICAYFGLPLIDPHMAAQGTAANALGPKRSAHISQSAVDVTELGHIPKEFESKCCCVLL